MKTKTLIANDPQDMDDQVAEFNTEYLTTNPHGKMFTQTHATLDNQNTLVLVYVIFYD